MQKRITLFDDDLFFQKTFEIIIEDFEDIRLAGAFVTASNLVNDISSTQPDVVLMDIDMPDIDGIEAVHTIRKYFPSTPVIMLTQHEEEEKVVNSICAGANGYLLKTTAPNKIVERILDVIDGGSSLDPVIAKKVLHLFAKNFTPAAQHDVEELSEREKEVLTLLVNGKPYKSIAFKLGISYETVRMHVKNIYRKLRVSTVSGAVAKAVSYKLVEY